MLKSGKANKNGCCTHTSSVKKRKSSSNTAVVLALLWMVRLLLREEREEGTELVKGDADDVHALGGIDARPHGLLKQGPLDLQQNKC